MKRTLTFVAGFAIMVWLLAYTPIGGYVVTIVEIAAALAIVLGGGFWLFKPLLVAVTEAVRVQRTEVATPVIAVKAVSVSQLQQDFWDRVAAARTGEKS